MAAAAAAGAAYAAACAAAKAAKKAYKTAGVMDDSYQLVYAPPNKLTIAEAFTLLWQDAETGDISGRKSDLAVQGMAIAAMITDLILMGKLVVNSEDSTNIFGMSKEKMRLINGDVESPLPDQAAFLGDFLKIFIEYNAKKDPRTLDKWVEEILLAWKHSATAYITMICDSLIAKGIVHKESVWNGSKFPTDDPSAEAAVHDKMRDVLLNDGEPDLFTTVLIQLSVEADKQCVFKNPFMSSVFSKEEQKTIQPRLAQLKEMADKPPPEEEGTAEEMKKLV